MKKLFTTALVAVAMTGCATTPKVNSLDTSKLMHVKENTATLVFKDKTYLLESYIKPFQRPYYVKVTGADGQTIPLSTAKRVAKKYIRPRGCTTGLRMAPQLNRHNTNKSQWLIGVLC